MTVQVDTTATAAPGSRILIVDDDKLMRNLIKTKLELAGFVVDTAANGALALEQVERADLVLTDVNMPELGGISLFNRLQELRPDLPVILMTGLPQVDAAIHCIKTGAVDYLQKPVNLNHLCSLIQETMVKKQVTQAAKRLCTKEREREFVQGYKVISTLGQGEYGTVFHVRNALDGQDYALKILKSNHGGDWESAREAQERFAKEAEVASMVDHPNVVKLADFGISEDSMPFIVFEYVRGKPLSFLIANEVTMSYADKARIILQCARGLGAIHAQGVYHRDVKPGNILINDDLTTKLTDFGIAHAPDSDLTAPGQLLGSPAYLSPEGWKGVASIGSDLFSLGVTAYQLILGVLPWPQETLPSLMCATCSEPLPPPQSIDPKCPRPLTHILVKMLEKDPIERYQSTDEIVTDLSRWIRRQTKRNSIFERFRSLRQLPIISEDPQPIVAVPQPKGAECRVRSPETAIKRDEEAGFSVCPTLKIG